MVAEELPPNSDHLEHQNDNDYHPYDEEDDQETLSLCDLPINNYSDSFKWEDDDFSSSSKKYQSSNDDEDNDNFFEFFSEDFTASTYPNNKEIIFCGKLIPLVGNGNNKDHHQKSHDRNNLKKPMMISEKLRQETKPRRSNDNKKRSFDNDNEEEGGLKMALPAAKYSKWYLFMSGMVRAPSMEMELRDMRNRQSRRSSRRRSNSATMFSSFDEYDNITKETTITEKTTEQKVSSKQGGTRSGKGLWGFLKVLGCGSRRADVVAKAAYGCSPIPNK